MNSKSCSAFQDQDFHNASPQTAEHQRMASRPSEIFCDTLSGAPSASIPIDTLPPTFSAETEGQIFHDHLRTR